MLSEKQIKLDQLEAAADRVQQTAIACKNADDAYRQALDEVERRRKLKAEAESEFCKAQEAMLRMCDPSRVDRLAMGYLSG